MKLFPILLLFNPTLGATPFAQRRELLPSTCPDPTGESQVEADCTFYNNCVEASVECGADGYALGYGGKYCGRFVESLDDFSTSGQSWILGTLTCLKDALVPIVELPGGTTCDSLATTAFDSHVFCYIDNGFCDEIFNFLNPLELGEFVKDLLGVFELVDFAQYVAIKQVFDVLTQCPFYGGKEDEGTTGSNLGIVESLLTCPEGFDGSPEALTKYREDPYTDKTSGSNVYLGYKSEYAESCESCGYTKVNGAYLYGYNYAWNSEVGTRAFWEDEKKGYGVVPKWWENCKAPYKRNSWWGRFSGESCSLPTEYKFLGETCGETSECSNSAISKYVDVVCGTADGTCVLAEDAEREGDSFEEAISIFKLGDSQCSNCRVDKRDNTCQAYGGGDPFEVDTTAAVAGGGVLAFAGIGLIGVGVASLKNREKRRRETQEKEKMVQMGWKGQVV